MTIDPQVNQIIENMMARENFTREQAEAEYDLEIFSDYYKDVHGIRPRWMYEGFRTMNAEQRQAEFDALSAYCNSDDYRLQNLADEEYYRQRDEEDQAERVAYLAKLNAEEEEQREDKLNYWTVGELIELDKRW